MGQGLGQPLQLQGFHHPVYRDRECSGAVGYLLRFNQSAYLSVGFDQYFLQFLLDAAQFPWEPLDILDPLEVGDGHASGVDQQVWQAGDSPVIQDLLAAWCNRVIGAFDTPFDDPDTLKKFADVSDCASLEWENIPVTLTDGLEKLIRVRPGSKSLGLAQDRTKEKQFLTDNRIPVTKYAVIESPSELGGVQIELPWIVKTATLGYDGHGQWKISNSQDIARIENVLKGDGPWVVEKVVPYKIELSVVVGYDGRTKLVNFPPTENIHEKFISTAKFIAGFSFSPSHR